MIRAPEFMEMFLLLEEHPEWRAELRRLVLTEELLALPELVQRLGERVDALETAIRELTEAQRRTDEALKELAEAQRRTEMRVEELAEAQRRTDEALKELAEAQRRTDEAIRELAARTEERFSRLEEAQRRTDEALRALAARTEERFSRLEEAQRRTDEKVDRLATEVGALSRLVGATAEDDADSLLRVVLPEKGYQLLGAPSLLRVDGDVDVVAPAAKDGQTVWVVVEAKVRISWRHIEDWANRMRSEGYRQKLASAGVPGPYLVYAYGIRMDKGAEEAARTFGIGLLTGRGELVPPGSLIPSVEVPNSESCG